jgi:hypothetical protein
MEAKAIDETNIEKLAVSELNLILKERSCEYILLQLYNLNYLIFMYIIKSEFILCFFSLLIYS